MKEEEVKLQYEAKRLKLLFVAVTCDEAFFRPVKRGIADAANMLGVDAAFTGSKGVDSGEMSEIVRRALADGIDGIALDIFDSAAFAPVIAEAREKGVPVVAFNINHGRGSAGNLSGIAQDFLIAGMTLGREVIPDIRPGSTVLLTMHDQGISALEERRDGIKEALENHDITWIETVTGHHPDKAALHVLEVLRRHPEISAILCTGQADTEGAALAIEQSGARLLVAGFDLSPEILRLINAGYLALTIDQQPYTQGFYPVVQLTLNIRYGLQPVDMDAGACVIDHANASRIAELAHAGYR